MDSNALMSYIDIPVWSYNYDPEIRNEIDSLQTSVSEGISYQSRVIVVICVVISLKAVILPQDYC